MINVDQSLFVSTELLKWLSNHLVTSLNNSCLAKDNCPDLPLFKSTQQQQPIVGLLVLFSNG